MSNSNEAGSAPRERGSFGFALLLIVLAVVAYYALRLRSPEAREFIGIARPPLTVAGWLNTDAPLTDVALRGKVVLIDNWASWCGPCRAGMPRVVEFRKRFRDEGVVVIGLTPEKGDELPGVEKYVQSVDGLDWPIGYGAELPMDVMGVTALPTMVLFDKSGTCVWAGHEVSGLDEAAIAALAAQP
jgi:thiol-disulfide isomerase/thioredoxin